MSDHQVSEELYEYWIVSINLNLEVLDQFLKHVLQHSKLNLVVHSEDLDRYGLVDR